MAEPGGDPGQLAERPSAYAVLEISGKGLGVVATKRMASGEEVLRDTALLSVRTFMLLNGVVVFRRSRVEALYEALPAAEQRAYRSLSPGCSADSSASTADAGATAGDAEATLRSRRPAQTAVDGAAPPAPTPQQHRDIWDRNGFHFCEGRDVAANRWLHFGVFPAVLTVLVGGGWAYMLRGEPIRSILGAGVLFYAMLGPVTLRLFYLGSQALFLEASRVNHSCQPNASWHIEGNRGPLGTLEGVGAASEPMPSPARLSLRATRAVAKGEELTIDYIPELAHLAPLERRNLLEQEYGFRCACKQCEGAERAASQRAAAQPEAEAEEVW